MRQQLHHPRLLALVLMDTGEFIAIGDRITEEESTGFRENARWPNPGPIYIEFTEPSPALPEGYKDAFHGYIISETRETAPGWSCSQAPPRTEWKQPA